jgi:hypothetical protein
MARAWERAGLKPTGSGEVYGERKDRPTGFQLFMAEIDRNLLGSKKLIGVDERNRTPDGLPTQYPCDPTAFYAEVTRWLHKLSEPR